MCSGQHTQTQAHMQTYHVPDLSRMTDLSSRARYQSGRAVEQVAQRKLALGWRDLHANWHCRSASWDILYIPSLSWGDGREKAVQCDKLLRKTLLLQQEVQ